LVGLFHFSNFGSLKSTETGLGEGEVYVHLNFSNFGSLKSTETEHNLRFLSITFDFSNFGSLKSTETDLNAFSRVCAGKISAISAR